MRSWLATGFVAVLCLGSDGCAPALPSADEQMAGLREQTSFALTWESGLALPSTNFTYENVAARWADVRAAHEQMLRQLPTRTAELQARLQLIDQRLALLRTEQAYRSQIEFRELRRGAGTSKAFGLPGEGIFGEVKNRGDRTVTRLGLTFELLDAAGHAVGEEAASWIISGSDVLKPNYTRPFGTRVERPPSDWVAVKASVSELRLSREGLQFPEEADTPAPR